MKSIPCYYGEDYKPENERSPDLDHRKTKSEIEEGYIRDLPGFHEPGLYERKNAYGESVTHQDGRSYPSRNSNAHSY